MATIKTPREHLPSKTLYHVICVVVLQFLVQFAQGQGPGTFQVLEESPVGTLVGRIDVKASYVYVISRENSDKFSISSSTGEIRTSIKLDRESLQRNPINLLVEGTRAGYPTDLVDLNVEVLDINDNDPTFDRTLYDVAFPENSANGSQQLITTAKDRDLGVNGTIVRYTIVSGNDDGKFQLQEPSSLTPFMYLVIRGPIDRETKDSYQLNISAEDGGRPPRFGFLQVHITVTDVNDESPTFNPSEYKTQVNESAPVGTSVIRVEATDADGGANAIIRYTLSVDDSRQFSIDEITGVVRTISTPVECSPECLLTVEAFDRGNPPLSGRAYITITVRDENDHDPVISIDHEPDHRYPYSSVDENATRGTRVATVSVRDADSGDNGQTTLSIVKGNELNHFSLRTIPVNPPLNLIQVNGELDRERVSEYNLTLLAVDQGTPQRSSSTSLIIKVNDANDHYPQFERSQYTARLGELILPGSYVTSVMATDADSGPNSLLLYSFVSGNERNWFKIDRLTGLVTTNAVLDHEQASRVVMNISAEDGGSNPFRNYTALVVDIIDENDIVPTFSQTTFQINMEENQAPNSLVVDATAKDGDSGVNGTVSYTFHPDVQSMYPDTFQLDINTGRVVTLKSLDREEIAEYTIKVIARDGGTPSLSSTATIILTVIDQNDNSPTFYPERYYGNVVETQPAYSQVVVVSAVDPDSGIRGNVTYSFVSSDYGSFSINSKSGWITTTKPLLQSDQANYQLTVRATDGMDRRSSVDAVVSVTVARVNDVAPVFVQPAYQFTITEDSDDSNPRIGTRVGSVQATNGGSSGLMYAITQGDRFGVFAIDSTSGVITTRKKVDREENPVYNLVVIANGGSRFRDAVVTINVTDVNDNAPVFSRTSAEVNVLENLPIGHNIFMAEARDRDAGPNADLTYTLQPDSFVFGIDSKTGIISIRQSLDLLSDGPVSLTVVARDGGSPPKSASLEVIIYIQDVNDHTPVFPRNRYEVSIPESKPANQPIFQLIAHDADRGLNGAMVYNITRGNEEGKFGIFPDGTLYVAHALDREERDMYFLSVVVSDRGEEPRFSVANVTIYILDDNDNKPVFSNFSYNMYVKENMPAGTYVGSVKASDADIGRNAELLFALPEDQKNFSIDVQSGILYTRRTFDREALVEMTGRDYFTITVIVRDNGLPRQEDRATVNVHVTDDNDNAPQFARAVYRGYVMESAKQGTIVTTVTATDRDSGPNAALTYHIASGNDEGKFRVVESEGQIQVNGILDRETRDRYTLTIMASDSSVTDRLNATATVEILLIDDNDNAPVFNSTVQQVSVYEDEMLGKKLTTFTATDADLANNALLTYSITGGNVDGVFSIDPNTGSLYLKKTLDYELRKDYTLVIRVSDNGMSPLMAETSFRVDVLDRNDNAPVISLERTSVTLREDVYNDHVITTVTASDKDSGANRNILYSLVQQDPDYGYFTVNPNSGVILAKGNIDRENASLYELTIRATDQALPVSARLSAEKSITVVITDVNDNAPVFKSMDTIVVLLGSQGEVATVTAVDADEGNNGRVSYELSGSSLFSINPTSGRISVVGALSSSELSYPLSITAKDGGAQDSLGPRSTLMTLSVIVSRGEANAPRFTSSSYTARVNENVPVGTSVSTVQASATFGANVEYFITGITSRSGDPLGKLFQVDKSSGRVTTAAVLDREVLPETLVVEIYATEFGASGQYARRVEVVVTLQDENDTPPVFRESRYVVTVPEDRPVARSVLSLDVYDPDSIGTLTYTLTGQGSGDFRIDSNATVWTVQALDRERRALYELQATANDGRHTARAQLIIQLSDVNDQAPVFSQPFFTFDVPEDTNKGTTVASVTATDADEGANGEVVYDFGSDWGKDKFQLDSLLGTITVVGDLNFEEVQVYVLKVVASDRGSPALSSTATVYINVDDVNDNPPIFDPASFSALVWENAPTTTILLNVSATDIDSGKNGELRYSLTGGDSKGQFGIGPVNGTLYTTALLDREDIPVYRLIVTATDQAPPPARRNSATATVEVQLRDMNDCPPAFVSPNVTSVRENTAIGTAVFTVNATDKDSGENGQVRYSVTAVGGGTPFTVDPVSGELRVNGDLDRERQTSLLLTLTARDNGQPSLSATQTLKVIIEDANDNPPVFQQSRYEKTVAENVTVGTSLLRVLATDLDEGLNGVVRYFIAAGDDNYDFSMDMSSGVLRVQKSLDYERRQGYTITVHAEDSGIDVTRTASATVVVNVTDVNDNMPVFLDSPYFAYVQENVTVLPVHVVQVSARDDDSLLNSRVTYALRNSELENIFSLNQTSGEIRCHVTLDRETRASYTLTVIAIDSVLPRQTGTGLVTVFVKDVNDHTPTFESNGTYMGHVMENLPPYSDVIMVKATDADEGENAEIVYSLGGSGASKFGIHSATGQVFTLDSLDRETKALYQLEVTATDRGIPPRSATITVQVSVDDANDNTPAFERQDYPVSVLDPTNNGDFVLGVTAVDQDVGDNGKVYYVLSGPGASAFHIGNSSGVITAAQRLEGAGTSYSFSVQARDQGDPPRSSITNVRVTLTSVSSSGRPIFGTIDGQLNVAENSPVGLSVTTVTATTSRTSRVTYHIAGGNVDQAFAINEGNGTVTVAGVIDYEVTHQVELWVEARDGGSPSLSSFARLPITILDVNDNVPRFSQTFYNTSINENVPRGFSVLTVHAVDADSGNNGQVEYVLVPESNKNNTFQIHPVSGLISTANDVVDREGIDLYRLVVEAIDKGSPKRLTSTATVKVIIRDLNDNPPKFAPGLSVSIPETLPPHSFVIQITSTDPDLGEHAVARYELLNFTDRFAIDPASGNLTTVAPLDAETKSSYLAQVTAVDGSFRVTTYVSIRLLDVNDNAPVISGNTLSFDLKENQGANVVVGTLQASDSDVSSPNNQFYFSLRRPSSFFELDAETGVIRARYNMTYEPSKNSSDSNRYSLDVLVIDLGTPAQSSESQIIITVIDANNHAPVFTEQSYTSAVPVNANVTDTIIQLAAIDDKDYGENAIVEYFATGGNGSTFFDIDRQKGTIMVKAQLTGRQGQDLVLTVTARDKGTPPKSSSVDVLLKITDVNYFAPIFVSQVFTATFKENVSPGYVVATVSATDRDTGLNGQVEYFLTSGNTEGLFAVGKTAGELRVAKALDFESASHHFLGITARDKGLLFKETTRIFNVTLEDVNDNPPVFDRDVFDVYVEENCIEGTEFFQFAATDADTGDNARIVYSITGTDRDHFTIEDSTGKLRCRRGLDYETKKLYNFDVMALNPPSASNTNEVMKSVVPVNVHVTSVNEFYPRFLTKEYQFRISESAPSNTSVGAVRAEDQDEGLDGIIYYFFVGASNLMGFRIDPRTGNIYVEGRPDYESSPRLVLTVMAKNWGSVRGNDTDTCQVVISIDDANDPPVFSQSLYLASVREMAVADTVVITVSAQDNDTQPENQRFSYSLLPGGDTLRFKVDGRTGVVRTTGQGVLDRESTPTIRLIVGAVDAGTPPQTGSATVEVTLSDVNDNAPVFNPTQLVAHVRENQTFPLTFFSLAAHTEDMDAPPNQGPFRYVVDPSLRNFTVDANSGNVTTAVILDREGKDKYVVPVVVSDNGSPSLTSSLTFTILVDDINDTPPRPRPATIRLALLSGRSIYGTIGDVRPLDNDLQGNYTCRLRNDNGAFAISRNGGQGCSLDVVGEAAEGTYEVQVEGADGVFDYVQYTMDVQVFLLTNATLDNSVVLVLQSLQEKDFLEIKRYTGFMGALTSVFGSGATVRLYSLQALGPDLLLYVAVEGNNGYLLPSTVSDSIRRRQADIETQAGVTIGNTGYSNCSVNPCLNSGTCRSHVVITQGFQVSESDYLIVSSVRPGLRSQCLCPPTFTGPLCETPLDPCGSDYCWNGGVCEGQGTPGERCRCQPGWTGPYCRTDINECLSSPCKNGGTCINEQGGFNCDCPPTFQGVLCESAKACASQPCKNGGSCQNLVAGGFSCNCPYGFFGQQCERSSQGFEELSFLEQPTLADFNFAQLNVSLYFATRQANALLLFAPLTSVSTLTLVALEIVQGRLRLTLKYGADAKVMELQRQVSDANWYRAQVLKTPQGASLQVESCNSWTSDCVPCQAQDGSCFQQTDLQDTSGPVRGQFLSVGGVRDFDKLLQYRGQVHSHDFVGCMHSFLANGRDVLDRSTALQVQGVSPSCPRNSANPFCSAGACQNGGTCREGWLSFLCDCTDAYTGPQCQNVWQPITFGAGTSVHYKLRESFLRDRQMGEAARRRRDSHSSNMSLRFHTLSPAGMLFYANTSNTAAMLWLKDGHIQFMVSPLATISDPLVLGSVDAADGRWHDVTVSSTGNEFILALDGTPSQPKNFGSAFNFSSLDIIEMIVGGKRDNIEGFDGCISKFLVDGSKLPFSRSTDKYDVQVEGQVEGGCSAVCQPHTCDSGFNCVPDGEGFQCDAMTAQAQTLSPGIIVVIVFFCIIIIAIPIVFVIFRRRGKLCAKKAPKDSSGKENHVFSGSENGSVVTPRGVPEIRHEEQRITHSLVAEEMSRPDLIGSNVVGRALPQPLEMEDGTVIIENGDMAQMHPVNDDLPEHYDLENASSIAPSDIDVVQHYKYFRDGKGGRQYKTNPHVAGPYRPLPHPAVAQHRMRESPLVGYPGLPRQSPVSLTGSALSMPAQRSPMTAQKVQRPSSANAAYRHSPHSPHNHLDRMGPPVRSSPLAQLNMATTPIPAPGSRSNSAMSLGSHHSHSSSSSAARLPNGHKPGRYPHKNPPRTNMKGLSVEEINRLNARAERNSPVSLLDAVSSSSEDRGRRGKMADTHAQHGLLEPPESSSDDSGANDSFTCSEFEYDNDRMRNDFDPSMMIFSKLTEVENENDEHVPEARPSMSDGFCSNGDSFTSTVASSEDNAFQGSKPMNGGFNFDSLLNWGPNFDKLVGVFKDIALLPDNDSQPLDGGAVGNDHEEYV